MTTPSPIHVRGIAVWCVVSFWVGYTTNVQEVLFLVDCYVTPYGGATYRAHLSFPYSFPLVSLDSGYASSNKIDYVRNITDKRGFDSVLYLHREDLTSIREKFHISTTSVSVRHECIGTADSLECLSSFMNGNVGMIDIVSVATLTDGRLISERFEKTPKNGYGQDLSGTLNMLTGILRISNYSTIYNQLLGLHHDIQAKCKAETLDTKLSAYQGNYMIHLTCTVKTTCPLLLKVRFSVNGASATQADNRAVSATSGSDVPNVLDDRIFVAYATQDIPKSGYEPVRLACDVESNTGWRAEYSASFNRSVIVGDSSNQHILRTILLQVSQITTHSFHRSKRSKPFDSRAVIVGIIAGLLFILTVLALIYMQRKSPMPCVCV
ncbi:m146 protein [Murid betaherpesvirus 1]|nr:m146 protein [Murid betaherpesvirus 1]